VLVSENAPPCLKVCFYYAPKGELKATIEENTAITQRISVGLVRRGFMIDYAPGKSGSMSKTVVNSGTRRGTVEGLVKAIVEVGEEERILIVNMCGHLDTVERCSYTYNDGR
jgi:glutamate decarboxylase